MDKAYISEHQLIARYVQGGLAGDELTTFEIYMLEHPEIVDDVEFERGMQDALSKTKNDLIPRPSSKPTATHRMRGWPSRPLAIAASLALAISATFSAYLFQMNSALRGEISSLRNPTVLAGEVWIEPIRGEREWVIEIRQGAATLLHVDVSAIPAMSYAVTLRGEENNVFWTRSGIRPDEEKTIGILLTQLSAGRYQLSIHSDDNVATAVSEYSLLLRTPDE